MHMQLYTRPKERAHINANEAVRVAYHRRGHAELAAASVEEAQAIRIVDAEIRAGAALQAEPIRVTRSSGGDHDA